MANEIELGNTFDCGLVKLKCVEGAGCTDCFFISIPSKMCGKIIGMEGCDEGGRSDGRDVIFIEVKE